MTPRPGNVPLARPSADRGLVGRSAYHLARWGPLAAVALLTYLLYPVAGGVQVPVPEAGSVARQDVLAPFDFVVRKSPAELQREGDALAATVRPIFEYRTSIPDSVSAEINALFKALDRAPDADAVTAAAQAYGIRLSSEEARFLLEGRRRRAYRTALLEMVRGELSRGVAATSAIGSETAQQFIVRRAGTERVVARDSVMTFARFLERRSAHHPAPNSSLGDQIFVKCLNALFRPTLVPNVAETEALRNEMRASVDTVKDMVRANQRIIAAHEVVTPEARDRLLALRSELVRRGATNGPSVPAALGQILTDALILSIFWLLLMLYRRETYASVRQMNVVGLLFALAVAGAAVNFRYVHPGPELIPIPFVAMLLTVLFSGRVAIVGATVLAVLLASQPAYGGAAALYVSLLGGVAGALGIRVVRRRSQLLVTCVIVALTFAVTALTIGLRLGWSPAAMGASALRGAVNAFVSAALVMISLPVFESLSRLTTDFTLLELSDPTRPLLRRLATEAPGTYAHSVAMANLCETACNAIGANGLLARVGCYYHDVGKIKRPQFFVENQLPGNNPHDKLRPEVSASIIRNHVKEGVALADEAKLPDVIKAFIPEHHGTQEITYFLDRARMRGDQPVDPDEYRYPGPRPRSVETAVAMLGDGVEAAIRVLDDPSPQTVRDAIEHIFRQRIESGQLTDAPLTLAQLDRVREEFVRALSGMYHNRIDYPAAAGGITAEWEPAARS